jgi:hypothetical protein
MIKVESSLVKFHDEERRERTNPADLAYSRLEAKCENGRKIRAHQIIFKKI